MNEQAKPGDTIRIVKMVDPIHTNESGKEYIVEHIDDAGHLWCKGLSVSVLPDVDEYQIIKKHNNEKE